jgi:hypothetical protein
VNELLMAALAIWRTTMYVFAADTASPMPLPWLA